MFAMFMRSSLKSGSKNLQGIFMGHARLYLLTSMAPSVFLISLHQRPYIRETMHLALNL